LRRISIFIWRPGPVTLCFSFFLDTDQTVTAHSEPVITHRTTQLWHLVAGITCRIGLTSIRTFSIRAILTRSGAIRISHTSSPQWLAEPHHTVFTETAFHIFAGIYAFPAHRFTNITIKTFQSRILAFALFTRIKSHARITETGICHAWITQSGICLAGITQRKCLSLKIFFLFDVPSSKNGRAESDGTKYRERKPNNFSLAAHHTNIWLLNIHSAISTALKSCGA